MSWEFNMLEGFVGRETELASLNRLFDEVKAGGSKPGRAVLVRGRRRVGKSHLVEEFCFRSGAPVLFNTAMGNSRADDIAQLLADARQAGFEVDDSIDPSASWNSVLRGIAEALPDKPSIWVMDEAPYLIREDESFEGALQAVFDRVLSKIPVLLILIGSEVSAMEKINSYGRPFYQRGSDLLVKPLTPQNVKDLTKLESVDALDAYLVTGGMPLLLRRWQESETIWQYLARELADPASPLLTSGELTLAGEFPADSQARSVMSAIGNGERTFSTISATVQMPESSLVRAIDALSERQVITRERALSTKASNLTRYRIADPYLRFWLHFGQRSAALAARGRSDLALADIQRRMPAWRGRAIEPVIRELLWQKVGSLLPEQTAAIGSYWTRTNSVEVDLVGTDREEVGNHLLFIGSIKWKDNFTTRDYESLLLHRTLIPGATDTTALLAVAQSAIDVPKVIPITASDLL